MFRFPLETLLKHRKFLEDSLQKELAMVRRSEGEEQQKLSEMKDRKAELTQALERKLSELPEVWEITLHTQAIDKLGFEIRQQEKRVANAGKMSEKKRRHLLEAMKRRKMLDRLREKRLDEYQRAQEGKERDFMNEVAVNRFNRETLPT